MTMLKLRSGDTDRGANSTALLQTLKKRWGMPVLTDQLLIFAAAHSICHPPTPHVFEYLIKLCHCWRLCVASFMAVVKEQNYDKKQAEKFRDSVRHPQVSVRPFISSNAKFFPFICSADILLKEPMLFLSCVGIFPTEKGSWGGTYHNNHFQGCQACETKPPQLQIKTSLIVLFPPFFTQSPSVNIEFRELGRDCFNPPDQTRSYSVKSWTWQPLIVSSQQKAGHITWCLGISVFRILFFCLYVFFCWLLDCRK